MKRHQIPKLTSQAAHYDINQDYSQRSQASYLVIRKFRSFSCSAKAPSVMEFSSWRGCENIIETM